MKISFGDSQGLFLQVLGSPSHLVTYVSDHRFTLSITNVSYDATILTGFCMQGNEKEPESLKRALFDSIIPHVLQKHASEKEASNVAKLIDMLKSNQVSFEIVG